MVSVLTSVYAVSNVVDSRDGHLSDPTEVDVNLKIGAVGRIVHIVRVDVDTDSLVW